MKNRIDDICKDFYIKDNQLYCDINGVTKQVEAIQFPSNQLRKVKNVEYNAENKSIKIQFKDLNQPMSISDIQEIFNNLKEKYLKKEV